MQQLGNEAVVKQNHREVAVRLRTFGRETRRKKKWGGGSEGRWPETEREPSTTTLDLWSSTVFLLLRRTPGVIVNTFQGRILPG